MNVLRIIACCGIMRNPHHKFSVSFLFSTSCFYQRLVQRRVPQSIVSNQQRMMGPRDTHSLSRKFFFAAFSFPPSSFACYPKFVLPATSHTNAIQSRQLPIQLALTRTFFGCCLVWRVKSKRQLEIMLQAYNMTSKCGKKKAQHKKLLGFGQKFRFYRYPLFLYAWTVHVESTTTTTNTENFAIEKFLAVLVFFSGRALIFNGFDLTMWKPKRWAQSFSVYFFCFVFFFSFGIFSYFFFLIIYSAMRQSRMTLPLVAVVERGWCYFWIRKKHLCHRPHAIDGHLIHVPTVNGS